ncbi:MAG TPA: FlgD immunoglobulin-like domain containing protein [Candidatus Eisenbacteria bacterium]|nr:FlgD immunoglobulin-like domain containing protein [Candidatus Eisenbacteria bacterium]
MTSKATNVFGVLVIAALGVTIFASAGSAEKSAAVPVLTQMSPAGQRAALANGVAPSTFPVLDVPAGVQEVARTYASQTREMGVVKRSGLLPLAAPTNIMCNNPAGDRVGETQSEVSVAVNGDTVVVGWNDSQGFIGTPITLTSYAYSTNGGATFTDGGSVPLAAAGDQSFGDTGWDTDEVGNWYLVQLYTRTGQQNVAVHHARFVGGVLTLDPPVQAAIGTSATGLLDKCLIAADKVTGNVYVAYTRFLGNSNIEIARSTTKGATWDPPIILDNTTVPTASKTAARPICGPNGEVYVVWEKGANTIFCPDAGGNLASFNGAEIAFSKSTDFGVTYSPLSVVSPLITDFLASGPGDLRERANEFPDIAVDISNGCYRGNLYVTWHDSAPWTANVAIGPPKSEIVANNNNPGTPDLFNIGDDANGNITPAGDLDYWQFSATQGQNLLIDLLPQAFNCGVSGTSRQMRMRLFAVTPTFPNPTGFPDSLLAASFIGAFENRITWTAPATGNYLIRVQISGGTTTGTYILRVRPLNFAAGAARDTRDILVSRSTDGGATWGAPQRVNDDPAGLENRRPFVGVNSSGQVTAYWHDSRLAGLGSSASLTNIFGTVSRDGGATWSPNFQVTDESSFFSFNTIAVPNLGDYNQVSGRNSAVFHPAWSDQRISSGDVRTPNTNTYTAGRGPDTFSTGISFFNAVSCPADTFAAAGSTITRVFRLLNTGTAPDNYAWNASDVAGWIVGATSGTTGILQPGGFFDVFVTVTLPEDCTPPTDVVSIASIPVGDACSAPQTCNTTVHCELAVPALISMFEAKAVDNGVDLDWSSNATTEVSGWNLYRTDLTGLRVLLNTAPITMGQGGSFHFHDGAPGTGSTIYELDAHMIDGSERMVDSRTLTFSSTPAQFSFAIAGAVPARGGSSVRYSLPKTTNVTIAVYNIAGAKVRTLVSGVQEAGVHSVPFNLTDTNGRRLAAGVYMVKIVAGQNQGSAHVIALP